MNSTPDNVRLCAIGTRGHGYCGRTSSKKTADWAAVTCTDCHAARRADESANERSPRDQADPR